MKTMKPLNEYPTEALRGMINSLMMISVLKGTDAYRKEINRLLAELRSRFKLEYKS